MPRATWRAMLLFDRGQRRLQRLLVDVVSSDIEARERADMGDAAAHLPGADNADRPDAGGSLHRAFDAGHAGR